MVTGSTYVLAQQRMQALRNLHSQQTALARR